MIQRGEAVLGSCFIRPDRPDWHCFACRHEWFVSDDPARIEMDRLLASILEKHGKKEPNQPAQRNASTGSVSNCESPARRG